MDHATTMRTTYELINAGDLAGFGDLVADDFVEHQGGPGFPTTKEGTLDFFRALLTSFPDFRMNVEDLIIDGDKAVARVRVTGTHQGDFMGVPPSGKSVEVDLIDIMRFDGAGLLCEHWGASRTCCRSCNSSASSPQPLRRSTTRLSPPGVPNTPRKEELCPRSS